MPTDVLLYILLFLILFTVIAIAENYSSKNYVICTRCDLLCYSLIYISKNKNKCSTPLYSLLNWRLKKQIRPLINYFGGCIFVNDIMQTILYGASRHVDHSLPLWQHIRHLLIKVVLTTMNISNYAAKVLRNSNLLPVCQSFIIHCKSFLKELNVWDIV